MDKYKSFRHIVLVTQIGINIALPIVVGVYFGAFLDQKFSTGSAFLILGVVLGVFSGIAGVYRLVSCEFKNKNKKRN